MSKKMCKRIFSVILSLGLVMVQSMNVNAAGNEIGKYSVFVEYSCAITPQVRQAGNRLSGLTETAYASLLA